MDITPVDCTPPARGKTGAMAFGSDFRGAEKISFGLDQ
jgi:hypothetical protein